jgi:hypothetical protein
VKEDENEDEGMRQKGIGSDCGMMMIKQTSGSSQFGSEPSGMKESIGMVVCCCRETPRRHKLDWQGHYRALSIDSNAYHE